MKAKFVSRAFIVAALACAASVGQGCRNLPSSLHEAIVDAASNAVPVTVTTPTTTTTVPMPGEPTITGRIVRVYAAGDWLLGIELADMQGFPEWKLSNGKTPCGYLCINHCGVDKIGRNTTRKTLANLAHGSKLHQPLEPGKIYPVTIRSRDGTKETAVAPFEWPAKWGKTVDREFER